MHPLLPVLLEAATGRFPPADGAVVVLPPLAPGLEAVVSFTARAYLCTALPEDEALHRVPDAAARPTRARCSRSRVAAPSASST